MSSVYKGVIRHKLYKQIITLEESNKSLIKALENLYAAIDSCIELTPELLSTTAKIIAKAKGEST